MLSRRDCLTAAAAGIALAPAAARARESRIPPSPSSAALLPHPAAMTFPASHLFAPTDLAYLDNGSQHPISLGARDALDAYLARRMTGVSGAPPSSQRDGPTAKFARLINADPGEVTYVQSTTAGEQMVLRALGLPRAGGHLVTDTLHFPLSLPLYAEMERQGCSVSWVRAIDGRVRLADMAAAIRKGTKLVALSLVSTVNGFEHDLKAVCDLAHAAGALVYADIIHAAGCVPVDVKASRVDFAACASYKWLMGDFGLGFLYVRDDVRRQLERSNYGYYGIADYQTHIYPLDPPGASIIDYRFTDDTMGSFSGGTRSAGVIAMLDHSLSQILDIGVAAIQSHAQALAGILKQELPKRGYRLLTPAEARTPIVAALCPDAREALGAAMAAAKVKITLTGNRFRLTPSIQNGPADIERFLRALPAA